jgi:hypothetical protein
VDLFFQRCRNEVSVHAKRDRLVHLVSTDPLKIFLPAAASDYVAVLVTTTCISWCCQKLHPSGSGLVQIFRLLFVSTGIHWPEVDSELCVPWIILHVAPTL